MMRNFKKFLVFIIRICAAKFDMMRNFKNFLVFRVSLTLNDSTTPADSDKNYGTNPAHSE